MIIGITDDGWLVFEDGSSCSEPEFDIQHDGRGTVSGIDIRRTIDGGDDSQAALHARMDLEHLQKAADQILARRLLH